MVSVINQLSVVVVVLCTGDCSRHNVSRNIIAIQLVKRLIDHGKGYALRRVSSAVFE